jgi:hypothetical protein
MEGFLHVYDESKRLIVFETPIQHSKLLAVPSYVLYIGGMTDGPMSSQYLTPLAAACSAAGWALLQPVLSSSYRGYGTGSLATDAVEVESILKHFLERDRKKDAASHTSASASASAGDVKSAGAGSSPAVSSRFVLLRFSTGAQIAVTFMASAPSKGTVCGLILQSAVSDRDYAMASAPAATLSALSKARQLIASGQGDSILPDRDGCGAAVSAERFVSLNARLGADDLFSADLTDGELTARLGTPIVVRGAGVSPAPTLLVVSGADEFVPKSVDATALAQRFAAIINAVDAGQCAASSAAAATAPVATTAPKSGAPPAAADAVSTAARPVPLCTVATIAGADHYIRDPHAIREFVRIVETFLARVGGGTNNVARGRS